MKPFRSIVLSVILIAMLSACGSQALNMVTKITDNTIDLKGFMLLSLVSLSKTRRQENSSL